MKKLLFFGTFLIIINSLAMTQEVAIDMRYNVLSSEPSKDYFNWSIGNKKINDSYDAVTGASIARSTREFDVVRYDSTTTKKYTIPVGVRHLLLFPVASRQYTDNFHLTVHEEGQKLIIRFIVYGTVYQIKTDDKKQIDIKNACFLARNITVSNTLSSQLKPQYAKTGADSTRIDSIDWNKITLVSDIADTNASRKYDGTLTIGYNNGILTVKGTLLPLSMAP
ncbi:MAG: hypothetical protein LBV69_05475 [Bacteroidales bacterium]|jgi:hypothetical protein|nr:hypothetical protein [Bacteroidales bacterium]